MWKRKLYFLLNTKQRMLLRKLYYFPSFFKSKSYTENGIAIPPKALIFTGRGDFLMMGKQYVEKFKRLGNLKPEHKVLDMVAALEE